MKKRWIWIVVFIVYIGFIFSNSMTPADESSRQSSRVLLLALQLLERLGIDGGWLTEHLIRKMAHFAEYSVLGVLLWSCLEESRQRILCQIWLGTWLPLIDETIQLFTPGRSGQVSDVWLDMAGVLAGTCVMVLWRFCAERWHRT